MMGFFVLRVDDLLRTTESRGNWKTTHASPDTTQTTFFSIEKTSTHYRNPSYVDHNNTYHLANPSFYIHD